MVIRKILIQIHLWLGLASGIVLSIVGLTGALYVFEPELNGFLHGDVLKSKYSGKLLDAKTIVSKAEERFKDKVISVWFPLRKVETYGINFENGKQTEYFDPYTGEYLGNIRANADVFAFILELHRTLTLGETGSYITSVSALFLAFFIITSGIYLWWPRSKNHLKQSFSIKSNAKKKRLNYDLHNVGGFYLSIPLFFIAITGAYFHFYEEYQTVINMITQSKKVKHTFVGLQSTFDPEKKPIHAQQLLDIMDQMYPAYNKRSLYISPDSTGLATLSFLKAKGVEAGGFYRAQVAIDKYSGQILFNFDPENTTLGMQITRNWVFPIHYGEIGGWPTRMLAFLAGLMPAVLLITGFRIWQAKKRKKARKNLRTPVVAAAEN